LLAYEQHIAVEKKLRGDATAISAMDLTHHPAADLPFTVNAKFKFTALDKILGCSPSELEGKDSIEIECKVKVTADVGAADWVFPSRPEDYWKSKRSQHWTTYPLVPISTGIVRQKFRDVARLYDRQQIIHPAAYGFTIRFKVIQASLLSK
jgi:hypothetical protein